MHTLSAEQWQKHVSGLRDLNILASQASEFEYNKNRTEGKTGIVKPDLIPSKTHDTSPKRISTNKLSEDSGNVIKKPSPKPSPRTSPLKSISEQSQEEITTKPITDPKKNEVTPSLTTKQPSVVDLTSELEPSPKLKKKPMTAVDLTQESQLVDRPASAATTTDLSKTITKDLKVDKKPVVDTTKKLLNAEKQAVEESVTEVKKPSVSARFNGTTRPTLVRSKGSLHSCKPPNVLVYSDSLATRDSVITTLSSILETDMYTIYPLTTQQAKTKIWIDNTTLLVVCGYVAPDVGEILTEYFLCGGKMLSLCSDVLHIVLPTFRTHAEVREHELVQFSYGRWQKVKMMHHIFCYQPSPVKKHFSTDSDEQPQIPKKP